MIIGRYLSKIQIYKIYSKIFVRFYSEYRKQT